MRPSLLTSAEKDLVLALARECSTSWRTETSPPLCCGTPILRFRLTSARSPRTLRVQPSTWLSTPQTPGEGCTCLHRWWMPADYTTRDFLPWETAQAAYLDTSLVVAGSVAAELETRKLSNSLFRLRSAR